MKCLKKYRKTACFDKKQAGFVARRREFESLTFWSVVLKFLFHTVNYRFIWLNTVDNARNRRF